MSIAIGFASQSHLDDLDDSYGYPNEDVVVRRSLLRMKSRASRDRVSKIRAQNRHADKSGRERSVIE